MLIVFGGLPGSGKTTLAKALALHLSATYLRIDTIEQAIIDSGMGYPETAGYLVGYALATDNLRMGLTVIADSVNPLTITRDAWREAANSANVACIEVEIICSDPAEHRLRVETRKSDIAGLKQPCWQDVVDRQYEPWQREHIVIDTAIMSVAQAVRFISAQLAAE